jgi:hypothetical protein
VFDCECLIEFVVAMVTVAVVINEPVPCHLDRIRAFIRANYFTFSTWKFELKGKCRVLKNGR